MVMEVYIKFIMVILFQLAMMHCKTSFTSKFRWVVERESHKIARPEGRGPHKNVGINRQIVLKCYDVVHYLGCTVLGVRDSFGSLFHFCLRLFVTIILTYYYVLTSSCYP